MDRGAAVAADRDSRNAGRIAVRHRGGVAAGAQEFLGQIAARRLRASAAGAAAGRDRLSAADLVRPARRDRRRSCTRHFGIVFSFRWTGAALACGVMGFPLLVRAIRLSLEAIDRKLEDAASTLGANKAWTFATVTLPLALARHHRRHGAVLRQGARRIRRHHHLRLQHSRRNADHLGRDLYLYAMSPAATPRPAGLSIVAIVIALAALIVSEWFARRAGMRYRGD